MSTIGAYFQLARVGWVLVREGVVAALPTQGLPQVVGLVKSLAQIFTRPNSIQESRSVRLTRAVDRLGPSYVKIGQFLATRPDVVGVDWTVNLGAARGQVGDRVALQGNLDPNVLFAPPERIRAEVGRALQSYGPGPGHIFNLGHGISQFTPPQHVTVLVDAVHQLSQQPLVKP